MSHPASLPSRPTCSPVAVDGRSTLRRSAAKATSRFGRLTAGAHARRRREDVLITSHDLDPAFGVTVDQFARCLHVSGEFDLAGVGRFAGAAAALTVNRRGDVVVDLAGLRFVDAAGLSALVVLRNTLGELGHDLVLRNVPSPAARVFRVAGLADLLPVAG